MLARIAAHAYRVPVTRANRPDALRLLLALAFAMLIAVRLLTPAGFMPAFGDGGVAIVACPDADPAPAPMHGHHGGHSKTFHEPCPYAAAGGLNSLAADAPLLLAALIFATAVLVGRAALFLERSRTNLRPPSRAPPLSA